MVVAPATANILAKMAAGIADDLLSTTLLATRAPVLVAPAMNTSMYLHPATRHNLSVLRARGIKVIGPATGSLACGEEGEGRMVEPDEILEAVRRELEERESLRGVKVVVTAGGTREPLDAVRFLGNRSSGKMGFALAEAARMEGAEVVLISGPTWLESPPGVSIRMVETAREMYESVLTEAEDAEVVIKAAAVADFTPASPRTGKVKKEEAELTLELARTPDILAELGARKRPGQILVGFSAETDQVLKNALAKLRRKNLDLMVANDVSRSDAGFDVDSNQAVILAADGTEQELPLMSKAELARIVVERVVELRGGEGRRCFQV